MIDRCQDVDWDLFAMGALDEGVHRQMEEHLRSGCKDCRLSYEAAMETMTALACAVPQVEPSAGIAEALRSRIAEAAGSAKAVGPVAQVLRMEQRRAEPQRRTAARVWAAVLPWSVAAALALVALWLAVSLRQVSRELERSKSDARVLSPAGPISAPGAAHSSGEQPTVSAKLSGSPAASGAGAAGPTAPKDADATRVRALTDQVAELQSERDAALAQLNEARSSLSQELAARAALQAQLTAAGAQDTHQSAGEQAELTELRGQLHQANATIAELRVAEARDGRILAFFRGGPSRQIDLKGIDAGAGNATGVAYYAPDRGLMVLVRNLPQLPGGECYQLWSVHKSGTSIKSVGVMAIDGAGGASLFAGPSSDLRQLSALAITDEPKGGSISARGRKLLFGAMD
jgi:anti-sigma-K factor RskA